MSVVPKFAFGQNERFSIKRTLTQLENIFNRQIVKPLGRKYTNYLDFQKYLMSLPGTIKKMEVVLEKHIKALIGLEIIKNTQFSNLTKEEQQRLYDDMISKSWYRQSLVNIVEKIQLKVQQAMIENVGIDINFLREELQNISLGQFFGMRRILLSESQSVLNGTKEAVYLKEEEEFGEEFDYKWVIGKDKRTTVICKEIEQRVNNEGGKVSMNRLKIIVQQVSEKYMPHDFIFRDWTPHFSCRSSFIRVVL